MCDTQDDYDGQMALAESVAPFCDCCPKCQDHPCAGVMAGGLCDMMPCQCEDWDEDEDECIDDDDRPWKAH